MVSERTLYVILSVRAQKKATHRYGLNLPKNSQAIYEDLKSEAPTGYLSGNGNRIILDIPHPAIRFFLKPARDIGLDSYVATELLYRRDSEERLLCDGQLVHLMWDFENTPRTFRRRKPFARRYEPSAA